MRKAIKSAHTDTFTNLTKVTTGYETAQNKREPTATYRKIWQALDEDRSAEKNPYEREIPVDI